MKNAILALCVVMLSGCSSGQDPDNPAGEAPVSSGTAPAGPGTAPVNPGTGSTAPASPTPPATATVIGYAQFGPLTAAEQALVGTDKNTNGVRDDVDSWITSTYKDPGAQAATVKYSQWLTWTMLRGVRGAPTSRAELDTFASVGSCWFKTTRAALGENAPAIKNLEAKIFNSYARTKAYLAWNASTSGMPSTTSRTPCAVAVEVSKP